MSEITIKNFLREEINDLTDVKLNLPLSDLGIDSFDFLKLRVNLERIIGLEISDKIWTSVSTPNDLLELSVMVENKKYSDVMHTIEKRNFQINMPQMAMGGLSESWHLKELGDLHWSLITKGLETESHNLKDDAGNRLYATFTHISYDFSLPLDECYEGSLLTMNSKIERYGAGIFFSEITSKCNDMLGKARLMSSFTKRENSNSNEALLKSQPLIPSECSIPDVDDYPYFAEEYKDIKVVASEVCKEDAIFECEYSLNPFFDINGVGLLYFAAYPMISDLCELKYNDKNNNWALNSQVVGRDIFYFANCDPNERVRFRLHSESKGNSESLSISTLTRKSDDCIMAYIRTRRKEKV